MNDQLIKLNGKVSGELETLFRELAGLRAENNHLRGMLGRKYRYSKIVRTAIVDGHTILMAAFSGEPTGCVAMQRTGMTRRRWEWAVAFLRYAGIVAMTTASWQSGLDWVITQLDEAIQLMERAAVELDAPGGYRRLRKLLRRS